MNSPLKLARSAAIGALSHSTLGWNAVFPAIAAAYAAPVEDIVLDFASTSRNVFYGNLAAGFDDMDMTQVSQRQAVAVYAVSATNVRTEKYRSFDGPVIVNIDWMLTYNNERGTATGIEANDTESPADAIDEAMAELFLSRLGNSIATPSGVLWARMMSCERQGVDLEGDGYQQLIRYELVFEVKV